MAVASILYQVATRPDEQEKLYQECKRVLPDANATLTSQDLENMPYLKAFVKEVFRFKNRSFIKYKINLIFDQQKIFNSNWQRKNFNERHGHWRLSHSKRGKISNSIFTHFLTMYLSTLIADSASFSNNRDWKHGRIRERRRFLQA